jgi:hypothetical protein
MSVLDPVSCGTPRGGAPGIGRGTRLVPCAKRIGFPRISR